MRVLLCHHRSYLMVSVAWDRFMGRLVWSSHAETCSLANGVTNGQHVTAPWSKAIEWSETTHQQRVQATPGLAELSPGGFDDATQQHRWQALKSRTEGFARMLGKSTYHREGWYPAVASGCATHRLSCCGSDQVALHGSLALVSSLPH